MLQPLPEWNTRPSPGEGGEDLEQSPNRSRDSPKTFNACGTEPTRNGPGRTRKTASRSEPSSVRDSLWDLRTTGSKMSLLSLTQRPGCPASSHSVVRARRFVKLCHQQRGQKQEVNCSRCINLNIFVGLWVSYARHRPCEYLHVSDLHVLPRDG